MSSRITFEDNSRQILSESDRKIQLILTAIGQKAVTIWKKIITSKKVVDTGRFRNSTNFEVNKNDKSVTVGSALSYSKMLEIGTSKMKARPTLKPTVLEHKEDYRKIAEQIWKQ